MFWRKKKDARPARRRRPISTLTVAYPEKPTAPPSIPLPEPPPTGLTRGTDFSTWLGLGTQVPQNSSPRFSSDDEL